MTPLDAPLVPTAIQLVPSAQMISNLLPVTAVPPTNRAMVALAPAVEVTPVPEPFVIVIPFIVPAIPAD